MLVASQEQETSPDGVTHPETLTRESAALPNQIMSSENSGSEAAQTAAVSTNSGTNNEIAHVKDKEGEGLEAPVASSLYGTASLNGVGETSKVIGGQKASSFVDFPPYTKPVSSGPRYQRQRRSYPIPSMISQEPLSGQSFRFSRPDEVELHLDDDRDREALLKLMTLIANEGENGNDGMGGVDDDDSIDLGSFQRPVASPYWTPYLGRSSEPMNLMSSLLAEPPRTSSHGLYELGERPSLPLEIGMGPRATSLRDEDDTDGEWLEDAIPFQHGSHFKTRRSGSQNTNTEFTFNPVKSHFRRYMRAVPLKSGLGMEFMPSGGRFGAIAGSRMNRRRRATATGFPAAMHWM